jgi:hypothetical protein
MLDRGRSQGQHDCYRLLCQTPARHGDVSGIKVPALSPVADGRTWRLEGAVPGGSLTPVKVSVPAPAFVMLTLAGVRLAPACPLKLKLAGFTVSTAGTGLTARAMVALLLESAWLVAVTLTGLGEPIVGAVNKPDELTVPAVADQVTAVFKVLLTREVNCWVFAETTDQPLDQQGERQPDVQRRHGHLEYFGAVRSSSRATRRPSQVPPARMCDRDPLPVQHRNRWSAL